MLHNPGKIGFQRTNEFLPYYLAKILCKYMKREEANPNFSLKAAPGKGSNLWRGRKEVWKRILRGELIVGP
jgi:hypothetical protein